MIKQKSNQLSSIVLSAAIEVHKELGPGLLENTYELALSKELELRKIPHQRQVKIPVTYKGENLNTEYRIDILVDNLIILELKSVTRTDPIHEAQLLTYLRLSNKWLGLLLNFNKRRVNG